MREVQHINDQFLSTIPVFVDTEHTEQTHESPSHRVV
jgi:hypothetical protein